MDTTRLALNGGVAILAVSLLVGCIFGKRQRDKTEIVLIWLTCCAMMLRAVLGFLQTGSEANRSVVQVKLFGLATGIAIGLALALIAHRLVARLGKSSKPPR